MTSPSAAHSVFISYRRADTSGHAGRISDDLARRFGRPVAFRDVESIVAGNDFSEVLKQAIDTSAVCIVLIGDTWLTERLSDGTRRLDDPNDLVRREVEMALADADTMVLPVLVEGAAMPGGDELPAPLRKLAGLQAVELSETRWDYDMGRLIRVLHAAGAVPAARQPWRRWAVPLTGLLASTLVVVSVLYWRGTGDSADRYTGLWHLPNGSFWTVREKGDGLWVEETHYDSRQVWKQGPAELDDGQLGARLELVFDRRGDAYIYRLRLSKDQQSLIGTARHVDSASDKTLVLTREPPG